MDPNESAGPPLIQHPETDQMVHGSAACNGPYQFFESSSFRPALSRCASANSCFSLSFSVSNSFSLFASDTCRPPYFDRSGKTSAR